MKTVHAFCIVVLSILFISCDFVEPKKNEITILHMGNHLSYLEPHVDFKFQYDDLTVQTEAGGFPRLVNKIKQIKRKNKNTLSVHTGNMVVGGIYYNLFKGEADAVMMNEVCFDALFLGESEIAISESGIMQFLDFLKNSSCNASIISANIIPKVGLSKLARYKSDEYLKPYVIKQINNQKIAFIGINDLRKSINSSRFMNSAYEFLDEKQTAQAHINQLKEQGVKRFILSIDKPHKQSLELARQLTDVDVIIGDDSQNLLGEFSRYGLNNDEPYPAVVKNKDGDKVCVVESWKGSIALGELKVIFDEDGRVVECKGNMNLLLAKKPLELFDENGAKLDNPELRIQTYKNIEKDPQFSFMSEDEVTRKKLNTFSTSAFKHRKIATAAENFCLDWVPGSGESQLCNSEDTAQRGSDITSLVTNSFLDFIPQADIAIQNSGTVRADIKKGDITVNHVYELLPHVDKLILVELSSQQIKEVIEQAVESSFLLPGAYPYAANLRWNLHAYKSKGSRVDELEYKSKETGKWEPLPEDKKFVVVVNDFMSRGNDGYHLFAKLKAEKKVNTHISYSEIFFEYLREKKVIKKLHPSEYSTQNYFTSPP